MRRSRRRRQLYSMGDGGIRVWPVISGISIPTSSM
jgi:hypothetical protein